ncbi:hypothetical protein T05_2659 [Trichinella murrelli]|uniref:Uncharacterized protein n=1 Tax=Trichinella murrelli TaxID=144512 RepID=A0A0V0TV12_9BILA|nr:hypothetical protein T05_2659 [Trichinella murrelli]
MVRMKRGLKMFECKRNFIGVIVIVVVFSNGDDDVDDGGGGVGRKVYTESRFYGQTSRKRLSGSISYLNKTA